MHWHVVAVLGLVAFGGPALAHDDGPIPRLKPTDRGAITKAIDADTSVGALFAMCPADAWRRRTDMTGVTNVTLAYCGRDPKGCLTQCLAFASGQYCFTLAQILQDDKSVGPLYGEKLYLMACSSGEHGGCVNRAASIRNADYPGDPIHAEPEAARAVCEYRSFAIGCQAGDAWGCAMLGQAFRLGQGVTQDAAEARLAYDKSCKIDPSFAACGFAKSGLAEMEKR